MVYVTPRDGEHAQAIVTEVRAEQEGAGGARRPCTSSATWWCSSGRRRKPPQERKARLDAEAGAEYKSDAAIFTGTASQLAELLLSWQDAGLSGYRLRPAAIPDDLRRITGDLVPELQRTGSFRTSYREAGLRERLGLARPASRYAAASG